MHETTKRTVVAAAVLAALAANVHAVQFEAGRGANIPQIAPLKTGPILPSLGEGLPNSAPGLGAPQLATPELTPDAVSAAGPEAAEPTPASPELGSPQGPQDRPVLGQGEQAAAAFSDASTGGPGWSQGARVFDGGKTFAPIDSNGASLYQPSWSEQSKISTARSWAAGKSQVFSSLDNEFQRKGGYFLVNKGQANGALASSGWDQNRRPVVVLSDDLLNRFNGRWEDEYRGAPWEFIASIIAREQVFASDYYSSIPNSAEKLAVSVMNQLKVFVDLTDGTTRSWATDKDFRQNANDAKSYAGWSWYEQLVAAARAAAANVGRNAGHLIDSKFLAWARDWVGPKETNDPAFAHTLWERYDGKYYRPGDARNGQPIPANVPRIDKATYDRESYKVYGADGKGSDKANQPDSKTVFGWIIGWLRGRSEI